MVLKKFNTNNTTVSITQVSRKHWSFQMPSTFFKTRHYEDFPLCHCEEQSDAAIHKKPAFFQPVTLNKSCHSEFISESPTDYRKTLKQVQGDIKSNKKAGFSLVELLMALLVASLLMAALAPVMTRRVTDAEVKILADASKYDKDSVITIFTDSSEQKEFNIPTDASRINVTMMGAGGAGGDASYGNKEITSSESNWIVPDNVNKLRVFLIGAGGGGASGGVGTDWAYGNIPNTTETYNDYLSLGETKVERFPKAGYGAPELDSRCKTSGETQWTYIADEAIKVSPGGITGSSIKITACGGGGGGAHASYGYGGGGGSGGFLSNKSLDITSQAIYIKIGGGGCGGAESCYAGGRENISAGLCNGISGGSGSDSIHSTNAGNVNAAGNGSYGTQNILLAAGGRGAQAKSGNFYAGNGGYGSIWAAGGGGGYRYIGSSTAGNGYGGGGPTTVSTASGAADASIIFQAGGGGGGGGCGVEFTSIAAAGGGGGGGGGYGAGGGGGGAGTYSGGGGSGGKSLNTFIGGGQGNAGQAGYATTSIQGKGGGGGGGYGGVSASYNSAGIIPGSQNIFGEERCNGGKGGGKGTSCQDGSTICRFEAGKPGALRMYYGGTGKKNVFKCQYYTKSNSGGGGGAGQIWIGELSVTPGQKLNFNIGTGGGKTTSYGSNGNNGGSTSITNSSGTTLISVSGGKGGKYESDETYINNSYGIGGGIKTSNVDSSYAKYVNWKKTNFHNGGENGGAGKTPGNGAGGGKGGQLYDLNGALLKGGLEGGAQSDGGDALITSYGAGGGGGGGVINDKGIPGYGGKGANGYIYIEWGGTNGGGGTAGEIVKGVLTNFDGTDRKMIINIGKGGSSIVGDGNGGTTTLTVKSGGKKVTLSARGGIKGNIGTSDSGIHGGEVKFPDNYNALYKDFVQNNLSIINGQKGINDYGGMGGYLACIFNSKDGEGNKVCNTSINSNDGVEETAGPVRPGCGGSAIPSPLYETICNAKSTAASPDGGNGAFGGGGGGGAVLNRTGGRGGNGGDGFIILEYKSVQ